jgi:hypothetical protein
MRCENRLITAILSELSRSSLPRYGYFGAAVWEETEKNGPEKTWRCAEDADRPLDTVNLCGLKGTTTDEDDEDLAPDYNAIDADKEPIPVQVFEDVEFIVKPSIVEQVKDLYSHERIEDHNI